MKRIELQNYQYRWISGKLRKLVENSNITMLTGIGQTGKSSLLYKEFGKSWRYLTLDEFEIFMQAKRDPDFLLTDPRPTIIDEAHRLPEIFNTVKSIVDSNNVRKFILCSSGKFPVDGSCAGQAEFLELDGMNYGEINNLPVSKFINKLIKGDIDVTKYKIDLNTSLIYELHKIMWKGGMPEILKRQDIDSINIWRENYIEAFIERELPRIRGVRDRSSFRLFMSALASVSGEILNASETARQVGCTQPTAHRYMSVLEECKFINRLPALTLNRRKRLVKNPKIFWRDTGTASYLAGFLKPEELEKSKVMENFTRNYVYNQLHSLTETLLPSPEIYHWQTRKGEKVDFVLKYGKRIFAIDVNHARTVKYRDTEALQTFLNCHPETELALIIYNGLIVRKFSEKVYAVPLSILYSS